MKTKKEEILNSYGFYDGVTYLFDDLLDAMEEYATIKSQEAFEHGKNVGHANAIGDSIYGSGFENKDINFDEWI